MRFYRPACSISLVTLFFVVFISVSPAFAEKRTRPGKGPDRIVEMRIKKARTILESAKQDADRANQVTMENQKINNYNIAVGKLRTFTKKVEEIEGMTGPNDPRVAELTKDYEVTKKYVYDACADIREKVLADQKAPEDIYKGSDKKKFKKMIMAAWKKAYPNDDIYDIRFHSAGFKRTRTKRWNDAVNQWQYNDVSALAVSVIVKMNKDIATIYPAFINKDNQDGSINTGVHTKFGGYVVKEILVKNL